MDAESLYLRKLLDAYGDHLGQTVAVSEELTPHSELKGHYNRQRVLFYSAEILKEFCARPYAASDFRFATGRRL